jgi:hypothetical protein
MKNRFLTYFTLVFCALFALPVAADPIAGFDQTAPVASSAVRSAATSQRSPRATQSAAASKAGSVTPQRAQSVATSRSVASRGALTPAASARSVASRQAAPVRPITSRVVRSRAGVAGGASTSRVSLTGTAIRGSATTSVSSLANRLYTGTYSNIIDPTTGLISADAYSNCLESYYACMDEICTARNPGQRRCACAGRVKTFANVEAQLQQAKEDLLKVSGQLSMLILTKGKDINMAFQLTDAEKTLNCVSYREASLAGTTANWCESHINACSGTNGAPAYCSDNSIGLNSNWMNVLNGADSDILANLQTYASTIDQMNVITTDNNNQLWGSLMNVSDIVGQLDGTGNLFNASQTTPDTLAQLWGYNLFQYAHNNVCNRVLDSCFNGIYEACGAHNGTTGPYNYNHTITVNNDGSDLNFVQPGNSGTTASATCYGYASTSGDPYSTLRRPVADARRSVLQKYALDANADCDLYGEELKTQATNMAYQKIAATQYLEQKRLEFAKEETEQILADAIAAGTNFNACIGEIYECYNQQAVSNPSWTTSRIRTYCAQVANVPSCYERMICNPSGAQFRAVIEDLDNTSCNWSQDYTKNTCRNIVTLNEILTKAATTSATTLPAEGATGDSAAIREMCLQSAIGTGEGTIRDWTRPCPNGTSANGMGEPIAGMAQCKCQASGTTWNGQNCQACNTLNAITYMANSCAPATCATGYVVNGGICVQQ